MRSLALRPAGGGHGSPRGARAPVGARRTAALGDAGLCGAPGSSNPRSRHVLPVLYSVPLVPGGVIPAAPPAPVSRADAAAPPHAPAPKPGAVGDDILLLPRQKGSRDNAGAEGRGAPVARGPAVRGIPGVCRSRSLVWGGVQFSSASTHFGSYPSQDAAFGVTRSGVPSASTAGGPELRAGEKPGDGVGLGRTFSAGASSLSPEEGRLLQTLADFCRLSQVFPLTGNFRCALRAACKLRQRWRRGAARRGTARWQLVGVQPGEIFFGNLFFLEIPTFCTPARPGGMGDGARRGATAAPPTTAGAGGGNCHRTHPVLPGPRAEERGGAGAALQPAELYGDALRRRRCGNLGRILPFEALPESWLAPQCRTGGRDLLPGRVPLGINRRVQLQRSRRGEVCRRALGCGRCGGPKWLPDEQGRGGGRARRANVVVPGVITRNPEPFPRFSLLPTIFPPSRDFPSFPPLLRCLCRALPLPGCSPEVLAALAEPCKVGATPGLPAWLGSAARGSVAPLMPEPAGRRERRAPRLLRGCAFGSAGLCRPVAWRSSCPARRVLHTPSAVGRSGGGG